MDRDDMLKQFMLGLLYPAVLGTVIYAVLGTLLDPTLSTVLHRSGVASAPWLKRTLLLTTVAFYCCDYLYIMFTRHFRPLFFAFDLVLLAGLYVTFSAINIGTPTSPHQNAVAWCYVAFIVVYLAWDILETRRTRDPAELQLYKKVIGWEVVSLVVLSAWLGFGRWIPNESCRGGVLAVSLLLITIRFVVLALRKRVFYKLPEAA